MEQQKGQKKPMPGKDTAKPAPKATKPAQSKPAPDKKK